MTDDYRIRTRLTGARNVRLSPDSKAILFGLDNNVDLEIPISSIDEMVSYLTAVKRSLGRMHV
jgi:hypothetical protein